MRRITVPIFSGVALIIDRPEEDRGRADPGWFLTTKERMHETRSRKGTIPFRIGRDGGDDIEIDVGLVDVIVSFEIENAPIPVLPRSQGESERPDEENFRHLDPLLKGTLHDQTILATSPHRYHSNGSLLFHYHNLIFGLRQEIRGSIEILDPLDMDSLFRTLAEAGTLNIIGGMRQ
jgi:hypothetical protein